MSTYFKIVIFILFPFTVLHARTVKLTVLNQLNSSAISYPHITINDSIHFIGDAQGRLTFEAPDTKFHLQVYRFQYQSKTISVEAEDSNTVLTVTLQIVDLFVADPSTAQSISIIRNTQINSKLNNFSNEKNKSYKLYTRFTISSEKPDFLNTVILGGLNLLGIKAPKLFSPEHHFYIMETTSGLHYKNKLHRKEQYTNTQSSGISLPLVFAQTSYEFIPNPYNNIIKIKGKEFISPIAYNALNRYEYNIVDSFSIDQTVYWTIKFAPKPKTNFNALYGLITISSTNYAIKNIIFYPAWDTRSFKEFCLTYDTQNRTLENYTNRVSDVSPLQNQKRKILVESSTYLYPDSSFNKQQIKNEQFDEYVVEINDTILIEKSETKKEIERPYPLSTADSLTYAYYEEVKYARFLQQLLNIGDNLYYGYIPLGKIDLETNKLINLNDVEGIRLGIGGTTNENFSKKWIIKGFIADGFADQKIKYGLGLSYLLDKKLEWKIGIDYSYQLTEAGNIEQYYSRSVFSSEKLRKYRLSIMDYNKTLSLYSNIHPVQNLDIHVATEYTDLQPAYTYIYKGVYLKSIHLNVLKIATRFAPFEEFIKLSDRKIGLGSKFPVFYLGLTKSFEENSLQGGYEYFKWDIRIDQRIKLIDFGVTNVQFIVGGTTGNAPYTALFNGKGSLKSPSVVIHNSFETMGYNEFLSDHYWALFIAHDFGRLYYKSKFFKPSVSVSYNTGSGSLKNPTQHVGLNFKTMEKNYSEVGLLLENIISLRLTGLKVGLGGGLFMRLGDYQYPEFNKNLVWKFAINFNI